MTPNVSPALDTQARLGEGALWCERTQTFWCTDIEGRVLHRWQPGGVHRVLSMPDRVGSFALTTDPDWLLLALAPGLALHHWPSGRTGEIVPVQADEPRVRLNDGRCDADGRFVVGGFNQDDDGVACATWVRADARDGTLRVETLSLPHVAVANACCFSLDGRQMVYADSPTRRLWRAAYPEQGQPGAPELFAELAPGEGFPDGACTDADGRVWVALWDGAALQAFEPDGRRGPRVALPAPRPTCPAFGGAALDTIYVTTATIGLGPERLADAPASGAVLAVSGTGARGRPTARFTVPPALLARQLAAWG